MSALTADLPVLADLIDCAARVERAIGDRVDALDARSRRVRSVWTGSAAEEYSAAHAAWVRGAQEMSAALAALRRIAATAHANYSGAVSANRAMWP